MKKYHIYIKNILFGLVFTSALLSCSDDTLDRINNNGDNPKNVQAKFIVTNLEINTAFSITGGDLSLYAAVYSELEAGVHNQFYSAEKRLSEPISTSTYNNSWLGIYRNIKSAKIVIDKCSEGGNEANNALSLAVAKIYLAYNGAVLTDLFGDAPYKQAGVTNANGLIVYMQPKVDKQEDIYKDIFTQLDDAIGILSSNPDVVASQLGNQDLIYKGDKSLWLKAAYGLRARYKMRTLARSTDVNGDLKAILSDLDKSFKSAKEEFKLDVYDGAAQNNPLAEFTYSRQALGASNSLVNKMKERNDPRLSQIFLDKATEKIVTDITKLKTATNGNPEKESQTAYDVAIIDYALTAPTIMMSYHELLFLKAEVLARLNDKAQSKKILNEAIIAAFVNLELSVKSAVDNFEIGAEANLSEPVANNYFTMTVANLFDTNAVKEIVNQKYLAFLGANGESLEAYCDYRRLVAQDKVSHIKLENQYNDSSFPHRFSYGLSDVSANPNVKPLVEDPHYVYKEPVWWAGGTR